MYTFIIRVFAIKKTGHITDFGAKMVKRAKFGPFLFFLKNMLLIQLERLNFQNLVSFRLLLQIEEKKVGLL